MTEKKKTEAEIAEEELRAALETEVEFAFILEKWQPENEQRIRPAAQRARSPVGKLVHVALGFIARIHKDNHRLAAARCELQRAGITIGFAYLDTLVVAHGFDERVMLGGVFFKQDNSAGVAKVRSRQGRGAWISGGSAVFYPLTPGP